MCDHANSLTHPDHDTDGGQASCRSVATSEKDRRDFFKGSHCRQPFNDDILLQQENSSSDNEKRETYRKRPANKNSQMLKYTIIRLPHTIKERSNSDSKKRENARYSERSGSSTGRLASIDNNHSMRPRPCCFLSLVSRQIQGKSTWAVKTVYHWTGYDKVSETKTGQHNDRVNSYQLKTFNVKNIRKM